MPSHDWACGLFRGNPYFNLLSSGAGPRDETRAAVLAKITAVTTNATSHLFGFLEVYAIKVTLLGTRPPVCRRVLVQRRTAYHSSPGYKHRTLLAERQYGRCFVVLHIEEGVELRDLQQVVYSLGDVEQLEFAALVLGSG